MEPFKERISPRYVTVLASHLDKHVPSFDRDGFVSPLVAALPGLELKQRVSLISEAMHSVLPPRLEDRYAILAAMLHPDEHDHAGWESAEEGLCGWGIWPLTELVGRHGLADFEASLSLLREMTKRGTSEFDVRPFIAHDQDRALGVIAAWAEDPNHHVRRLASEGTRPRLPWGMRLRGLIADPSPTLPILHALRDDPSDYVRRSVANHLNDIAKDHPDLVSDLAGDWLSNATTERTRLVRHACRTLIKQGHPRTLAAFGIGPPKVHPPRLTLKAGQVTLGGALEFSVEIASTDKRAQNLVIDYVLHLKRSNGAYGTKVFKWTSRKLAPGDQITLKRVHTIKPVTTRRYYAGEQFLSLRLNGQDFGKTTFELRVD